MRILTAREDKSNEKASLSGNARGIPVNSHVDRPSGNNVPILGKLEIARNDVVAPLYGIAQTSRDISTVAFFYLNHVRGKRRVYYAICTVALRVKSVVE